jgi:hypothetical protein
VTTQLLTQAVATDNRYRKALSLAANAGDIVALNGEDAYCVPSSQGGYYRVDADGCPCPDATYRGTLCKHQIAVAMLRVGTVAVTTNAARADEQAALRARHEPLALVTASQA